MKLNVCFAIGLEITKVIIVRIKKEWKRLKSKVYYAPNADFSVKYDGEDCKYFWDEDKGYKTWKIFNTLKIIGKFILKIEIPDLLGITGGKY